jgi:general secretion pathway protein J
MSLPASPSSKMLKKSASGVLASFRPSTYPRGYASALHSLGPCWTNFLSILQGRLLLLRTCKPFDFRRTGIVFPQPGSTQSGFTLVEVLVAIALLATIAAMVFGSLVTTTRVVDAGREHAAREQMVRRILRVMADEISLSKRDNAFPWVGVNGTQEGQPADTLAFLAMSDGLGVSAVKESETIRVVYTREHDRLIRFVRRNLYGLTDESLDQVELANSVKGFNVRYFDAQGLVWTDEWLTGSKMPKALLLEVTFQPPDADPWTVREWVTIGTS